MTAFQLYDLLHDTHFTGVKNVSYPMNSNVWLTLYKFFFDDGFNANADSKFSDILGIPYTLLLTKWGLCLNFNLQSAEKMLHIDKYAKSEKSSIVRSFTK